MKTMQPDNGSGRSAAFQTALADYARGAAQAPEGVDIGRLGVYRRLLLNNLKSFIDLCFSASGSFAEAGLWQDLQRRFLLEARPQSPFFNDIPKQFLDYVRSRPENERPSENILHMMAFETDLLHAETVIQPEAAPQWDENTELRWAEGARLKHYPCDFVSSGLERIDDAAADVLTWRDNAGKVYYTALDGADLLLLNHFQEAGADTLSGISAQLAALSDGLDASDWLEAGWRQACCCPRLPGGIGIYDHARTRHLRPLACRPAPRPPAVRTHPTARPGAGGRHRAGNPCRRLGQARPIP